MGHDYDPLDDLNETPFETFQGTGRTGADDAGLERAPDGQVTPTDVRDDPLEGVDRGPDSRFVSENRRDAELGRFDDGRYARDERIGPENPFDGVFDGFFK